MPRELMDNTTRLIPGDGVSPLVQILRKMLEKGYTGALSVELFLPEFEKADPYDMAKGMQYECETVMRKAKVI
jgi:2-keto-myo-inositol isomerase